MHASAIFNLLASVPTPIRIRQNKNENNTFATRLNENTTISAIVGGIGIIIIIYIIWS